MLRILTSWPRKFAFALFLLAYGFSLVCIGLVKKHPPLIYFSACALGLIVLLSLYLFLRQREEDGKLRHLYPYLLCGLLALLPVIQSLLGMLLEIEPYADLDHVFNGAIRWAEEGSYVDPDDFMWSKYFAYFPNNLGLTAVFAGLFSVVGNLGSDQYYLAAVILNSVLITASILLCIDILRRVAGYTAAFTGAAAFLILPPYYIAGAVFYTDTMSFVFPPLLLWLNFVARDKSLRRRWLLDLLWAIFAFIGYKIKGTPLIMLVAIWLTDLLQWRPKPLITQVIATVVVFVLGTSLWNTHVREWHLGGDMVESHEYPWVAWLVLGTSHDDRELFSEVLYSGENVEKRSAEGWKMLGGILQEKWRNGTLLAFYAEKTAITMGAGTLGLSDILDDDPWNDTWLHDWLLYAGSRYRQYNAYCSGVMLALVLLAMYAAIEGIRRKDSPAAWYPQPIIALLGIFLFLLAWEARDRYFSNFFSILIVAAVIGICSLTERVRLRDRHSTLVRGKTLPPSGSLEQ